MKAYNDVLRVRRESPFLVFRKVLTVRAWSVPATTWHEHLMAQEQNVPRVKEHSEEFILGVKPIISYYHTLVTF